MIPKATWWTRTALVALRLGLAAGVAAQTVKMPDLTGTWQLDKDASDDPEKVLKEARSSEGGPGGGGPGGMGGGMGHGGHGGHGGGGGGSRGGGDRGQQGDPARQDAGDWFASLQSLRIEHKEPLLTITDAAGRQRVVYTDGRKTEIERSHGGTTVLVASWKDGHVQVVATPESGPKMTETYAITADGSQLTVTTKIEGGRRAAVTIRRVYDSVKPGAPKPAAPAAPSPSSPAPAPAGGNDDDQSVSDGR